MKAPKSVTNIWFNLTGLLGYFLAIYLIQIYGRQTSNLKLTLLILLATGLPMIVCDLLFNKVYLNPSSGLNFSIQRDASISRVATKLLGLYAVLGLIACIYMIFPEYQGNFYSPYYELLRYAMPTVAVLAIPYFFILDRYLVDPKDSYWKFGMAVMRKREFSNDTLQLFLGWLVKAFFLPLMFIYFRRDVDFLLNINIQNIFSSFSTFFEFLFRFFFSIDLLYVTIGYMCTLRIFDSHIRTAEPSFMGWGVALFCYQPFWAFFSNNFLSYGSNKQWGYWLSGSPFYIAWGSTILLLIGIYVWATLAFGIRFSNLTNRGIITSGPYRFTKHPAYVSKNLAWWFISMPFMISTNWMDSVRHCVLLAGLNFIYFMRAKTEERHLGMDPAYREYANYIRHHGVFSREFWGRFWSPRIQAESTEASS